MLPATVSWGVPALCYAVFAESVELELNQDSGACSQYTENRKGRIG